MYIKPALQRIGTFRELTQIGLTANSDGASILAVNTGREWFPGTSAASEWEQSLAQTTS